MFGKNNNQEEGREVQDEEFEFYDMNDFEKRVFKKLSVIEMKVDALSGETNENQERIKNIQFQFTKASVWRLLKWLSILGIIYYAYVQFFAPFILGAQEKYYQIEAPLEALDQINETGILEKLKMLFPEADEAIDTVRPDTATSTSE